MKKKIILGFIFIFILSGCVSKPSDTQTAIDNFAFSVANNTKSYSYAEFNTTDENDIGNTDPYSATVPFFEVKYNENNKQYDITILSDTDYVYKYSVTSEDDDPTDIIIMPQDLLIALRTQAEDSGEDLDIWTVSLLSRQADSEVPEDFLYTGSDIQTMIYTQTSVFNEAMYNGAYKMTTSSISEQTYEIGDDSVAADDGGNIYISSTNMITTIKYAGSLDESDSSDENSKEDTSDSKEE